MLFEVKEYSWDEVYKVWKKQLSMQSETVRAAITRPLRTMEGLLKDDSRGILGYDWATIEEMERENGCIELDPYTFAWDRNTTLKGSLKTATMLAEVQTPEEEASVWIGAILKELARETNCNGIPCDTDLFALNRAARHKMPFDCWHYRMSDLVPEIYFPSENDLFCGKVFLSKMSISELIDMIQKNVAKIKEDYCLLRITSPTMRAKAELPFIERHPRI